MSPELHASTNKQTIRTSVSAPRAASEGRVHVSERLEQFEKRQSEIVAAHFFLLLVLAVVFAVVSWDTIRSFAHRFEALHWPGHSGRLFGVYAWKRTQEISELRGLVRGIEQRDTAPPSEKQLDQLFAVIARSQQGYRDLIDSFDDILMALTLDGEIRAANRSFADLVGTSFQEIIGQPLTEFLEEAAGEGRAGRARHAAISGTPPLDLASSRCASRVSEHRLLFRLRGPRHDARRRSPWHDHSGARHHRAAQERSPLHRTLRNAAGRHLHRHAGRAKSSTPIPHWSACSDTNPRTNCWRARLPIFCRTATQRTSPAPGSGHQPMLQGREITLIRKDGSPRFA